MSGATAHSWLANVAADASTINERMRGDVATRVGPEARVDARLTRWCDKVAEGDWAGFEVRLAASGWTTAAVRVALGDAAWPDDHPLPRWAEVVGEASVIAKELAETSETAPTRGPNDLPFGRLAEPFVAVAKRRAASALRSTTPGAILPGALDQLEQGLEGQLAWLASAVHGAQFFGFRRAALGALGERLELAAEEPDSDLYDEYELQVLADGYHHLFAEFPTLARRTGSAVCGWVANVGELAARRAADAGRLAEAFGVAPDVPIAAIDGTAGDTHEGRSVLRAVFADGTALAYKPRPMATHVLWSRLCRWLGSGPASSARPAQPAVDMGDYGWSAWIDWRPCATAADVAAVYRSAGVIAALGSVLGSTDLHYENVVVDGTAMVAVDNEMALQPDTSRLARALFTAPPAPLDPTVSDVGLLPTVTSIATDLDGDISALGRVDELLLPSQRWRAVGTNALSVEAVMRPIESTDAHLVVLDDEVQAPERHKDEILGGFRDAHQALAGHRSELAEWINEVGDAPVRVIVRPTRTYVRLLRRLADPDAMRSGVDQQIQAEILGRPLMQTRTGLDYWSIVDHEVGALADGDVPIFTCSAQATALPVNGATSEAGLGDVSAVDQALSRCAKLDDAHRRVQESLIRSHLALRSWTPDEARAKRRIPASVSPATSEADQALEAAVRIGARLARDAERVHDRSLHWVGATAAGRQHARADLQRTGPFLYGGNAGIGVLFAALAHATGDDRWRRLTIDTLRPILDPLHESGKHYVRALGHGGHGGGAGVAYALGVAGGLIDEADLHDGARAVVDGLVVLDPTEDAALDVIDGSAGTILGALALADALDCPAAVEVATRCAARLASTATHRSGGVVWPAPDDALSIGYAHGSAGIAAALATLATRTDDRAAVAQCKRLVAAAARTLEQSYLPDEVCWPDEPGGGLAGGRSRSWCHGSTGQLHALLGVKDVAGTSAELARQIDAVQAACATPEDSGVDSLCCGRAGQLEYWRRNDEPISNQAYAAHRAAFVGSVASQIIADDGRAAGLSIRPDIDIPAPGLFQGDAGVGYALAAVADPLLPVLGDWQLPLDRAAPVG